ncbi:MAG: tape measure protein [Chloroflexota bacterium]
MTTYPVTIIVNGQDRASGPLGKVGSALDQVGSRLNRVASALTRVSNPISVMGAVAEATSNKLGQASRGISQYGSAISSVGRTVTTSARGVGQAGSVIANTGNALQKLSRNVATAGQAIEKKGMGVNAIVALLDKYSTKSNALTPVLSRLAVMVAQNAWRFDATSQAMQRFGGIVSSVAGRSGQFGNFLARVGGVMQNLSGPAVSLGKFISSIGGDISKFGKAVSQASAGAGSFASFLNRIGAGIAKFTPLGIAANKIGQMGTAIQNLAARLGVGQRQTENFNGAVQRATGTSSRFGQAVGNIGQIIAGIFGGNILLRIADGLANIGRSAVSSASYMQKLTISLEQLAAKEIFGAGLANSMGEALNKAGAMAQGLMRRLRDLSISSPFKYQDILDVFNLQVAYGQASEQALGLTKALTDMAAAKNLGGDAITRMSMALGQMASNAQLDGQNLRELRMAGLDVSDVFSSQLGMSIEQVNQQLKAGKMTFADVSKAIMSYSEQYFGGAAERVSRTFSGLKSSFADLGFFASLDVLGPSLDSVTQSLGGVFDNAMALVNSGALKQVGAGLQAVTEGALGLASRAGTAVSGFFSQYGSQMQKAAMNSLTWGLNITTQLAAGMAEGIATALTAVMNTLSSMLSFFLAPGSPPRVAPDIDKWGTAAMGEWLQGMSQADFSALDAIQSPLKQALQAISDDNGWASEQFAGLSSAIGQALASGNVDESLFARIAGTLGPYGDQIAQLARDQIALAAASEAVKKTELELQAARDRQAAAQKKVSGLVAEYNEMYRKGASKAQLEAKLAQIRASEKERDLAGDQVGQLEEQKKSQDSVLSGLEERAKLQNSLVQQMLEMARLDDASAKGLGGAAENLAKALGGGLDLSQFSEEASKAVEDLKAEMQSKLKDAFKPVTDAWEKKIKPAFDRVSNAWRRMTTKISTLWYTYGQPVADKLATLIPDSFVENIGWAAGVVGTLALAFAGLSGIVGAVGAILASPLLPVIALVVALGALKTLIEDPRIQSGLAAFSGGWSLLSEAVSNKLAQMGIDFVNWWNGVRNGWTRFWTNVSTGWYTFWNSVSAGWTAFSGGFSLMWNTFWGNVFTGWTAFWDGLKLVWDTFWQNVTRKFTAWRDDFKKTWDDAWSNIKEKFTEFKGYWDETLKGVLEGVQGAWDGISNAISGVVGWIGQLVSALANLDLGKLLELLGFTGGTGGNKGSGKAAGGRVVKGRTYPVGERGVELFTPDRSGYIIPNHRLMPALAAGSGTNISVSVYADKVSDQVDEEALAWRIADKVVTRMQR